LLASSPEFTAVAVLTLALGIGANTAIFSVLNAVVLRPLPFPRSRELVDVWGRSKVFDFPDMEMSLPDIADMRSQNHVFQEIAPYEVAIKTLTGSGAPQQIESGEVSATFFPLLGMKPLYGRIFTAAEMQPGQDHEVILGYEFWEKQFGGNRQLVGNRIMLNDQPYTIIGIMPPQQHLGDIFSTDLKLWLPLAPTPEELTDRSGSDYFVVARLLTGVTLGQAQADLDAIAGRLAKTYPDTNRFSGFHVESLETDIIGDATTPLLVLLGAVGFVLLIACANVGSLFLSRGWTRRRELVIRSSLGATRGRLVRQLLVESLLVALIGGAFGLLFATPGLQVLRRLLPPDTPRLQDLSIDKTVLWFTLGASLLAGILFGLAPAVLSSRQEISSVMKEGGGGAKTGSSTRHKILRQFLVVGEMALALTLVIGATLALRSFARLRSVNLGFRPDHLLTMNISFPSGKTAKPGTSLSYFRQILSLTRGIPGMQSAGASLYAPLSGRKGESTFHLESTPQISQPPSTQANSTTPGYFETLGIPLIAGRDFTDADNATGPHVYIVNQAFAQTFFGNENPVGKRMWSGPQQKNPPWGQIVGEVGNVRDQATKEAPAPQFFAPLYRADGATEMSLVVRTKSDPLAALAAIEDRIWSINKEQPVTDVKSMDQLVSASNAQPRFQTFLLGVFGALGLLLALVGTYGVISYSVTQRTQEIGIRMALGAEPRQVMRLVLVHGLRLALFGIAVGLAASLALTRLMSSLLFGVSATDPPTFACVTILLVVVSLAACYVPARRAVRVDPIVALRHE
jgi:putative ABC transport system permease protein